MTLKEIIKGNYVYFDSLRQGFAYYTFHIQTGEWNTFSSEVFGNIKVPASAKYMFTIPLDDIGNGTLKSTMKAIECMRWIRKALESKELIKVENDTSRKTEPLN